MKAAQKTVAQMGRAMRRRMRGILARSLAWGKQDSQPTSKSEDLDYGDADRTNLNPRFEVPLVISDFPRLPTR